MLQGEEIQNFVVQAQQEDARGWIHEANAVLNYEDLSRLMVSLWAIWYVRRKVFHENLRVSEPAADSCFHQAFHL